MGEEVVAGSVLHAQRPPQAVVRHERRHRRQLTNERWHQCQREEAGDERRRVLCGDIRGSEGVGRDRGCRRVTAPAVEEDAGSRAAPAVEVDLRGWGGTRERRVWSAAAQEKGGGQAGVQGMEELGFVLSVFLYQWSAIRV